MRLLFVNASLTDGGSERAMTLVANQMAVLGHEVAMLLVRDKERTYEISPDVEVIQLTYASTNKLVILAKRLKAIRDIIKNRRPDCVVSFMWDINVMTLVSTLGMNVRKVVSERAFPKSGERSRFGTLLANLSYRSADAVVFQTPDAMNCFPAPIRAKGYVIPNIVHKPVVEPFEGVRSKRVVSVGRLAAQKNFAMLISAFAQFRHGHPEYVLDIFGDGSQRAALGKLAFDLGIADKVRFAGYVSDIAERINDASIFVMSSDYEGISNAMAEAMALGLPTVCTDCPVGGAALVIEDGVNGMLVPVGDVEALTAAMSKIADDEFFAKSISDKAKKVVSRFSAEKIGLMWEEVVRGEG